MAFLKYMDSLAMVAAFLILIMMIYRISYKNNTELTLFFAGSIGLATSIFLATTGSLTYVVDIVDEVEVSIFDPFFITIVVLTLALLSSGYLSLIDRGKRFSSYYTFMSLILAIIVGYIAVYQNVTAEVLFKPLFLILLIASMAILIIAPIIAVVNKIANVHALWSIIGWAGMIYAAWTQWLLYTGELVIISRGVEGNITEDAFDARFFTALAIGAVGIALDFALNKWNTNHTHSEDISVN